MAVLKIRKNPDPILRKKAKKVTDIDVSVQRLIDNMIETLDKASGVGLAANQVGVPLRVVIIHIPDKDVMVLINPEIIEKTGERLVVEGCLSIPGYQAELKRSESVRVKARDRQGKLFRKKATDLLAQAFEHEIDHLNGILYVDYLQDMNKLEKTDYGPD
ncbi:MAG: peptide deformylase [Chloroflexi bacterium]|nr:peptide deformylase [Chloroflexota bacterium]